MDIANRNPEAKKHVYLIVLSSGCLRLVIPNPLLIFVKNAGAPFIDAPTLSWRNDRVWRDQLRRLLLVSGLALAVIPLSALSQHSLT